MSAVSGVRTRTQTKRLAAVRQGWKLPGRAASMSSWATTEPRRIAAAWHEIPEEALAAQREALDYVFLTLPSSEGAA